MNIRYSEPEPDDRILQYEEPEPDDRITPKQALERDKSTVLYALWMMPLQDAKEVAAATGLSADRTYRVLKNLWRHGRATQASLGRTAGVRQRWWLTTEGVNRVAEERGLPIPWQVTETGLSWLIRRLPMVEEFYALAPLLWGRPDVLTPATIYLSPDPNQAPVEFTDELKMLEFQWMHDGEIHAVARYENGAWVPMIWVGSMVSGTVLRNKARNARKQLADGLRPAGWVIVCDDVLAEKQASDNWTGHNALVLTAEGRVSRPMRPSEFSSSFLRETVVPANLGKPETITTWLRRDGAMLALNGPGTYTLFRFIAEWPAATPQQLERGFGESYRAIVRRLRRAGLVVRLDGGYYLGRRGVLEVAHMDRVSWQSVHARFGALLKPDGDYRRNRQRHDRSLVDVALTLYGRETVPYAGWRALRNIPDVTQVVPDAVVLLQRDDGSTWEMFVELEFSARTPEHVNGKLDPYRLAQQHSGDPVSCLWLLEDELVRQRYARLGEGLRISTLTLGQFLAGESN